MPSQSPYKKRRYRIPNERSFHSKTGLYHHDIGVSRKTGTISDLESATLRFQRHDSISMALQSSDKQGRYRISNRISSHTNDTTLSPCHRSLQTNRDDIGSRIRYPPIPMTPVYHHAIAVSRQAEMISDLESNDPPIPMTGLYHQAIGVSIQKESISDLELAIL
ncbi:hypothetical protein AVEN_153793-1 [Araneus ventricosus]|uniref:Uncharacterized protein n=1 Tax=Araneus ventricosus TaxID=182803 RepID=A0A4Y1ZML4_ARAVE|nr:hypothetical protein AVEN_153793-1 [Araneus ventricosus]